MPLPAIAVHESLLEQNHRFSKKGLRGPLFRVVTEDDRGIRVDAHDPKRSNTIASEGRRCQADPVHPLIGSRMLAVRFG